MPSVNDVFGGETLKSADLQGREFTLTIRTVQAKNFDKGNKLVINFIGAKKALIANRTNSKRIAMLYGDNYEYWIGKAVTLYSEMVDFKGEPTWAIRVKAPPAGSAAAMPVQPLGQPQDGLSPPANPAPHPQYNPDPMPPLDRNSDGSVPF
jgi:hypothetical protein